MTWLVIFALFLTGCVERPAAVEQAGEAHYFIAKTRQYGPFATEAICNKIRAEVESAPSAAIQRDRDRSVVVLEGAGLTILPRGRRRAAPRF
jgi:hypothetical protein